MKVSAVHFDSVLGDIEKNYNKAEEYIKEAKANQAEFVALPEFFTTGFATGDILLQSIGKKEDTSKKMISWAVKYQITIGGSYLFFDGIKVQNVYCLACSDGNVYYHAKDIPTAIEGFYYENGDQDYVAETDTKNIGMCMCYQSG